MDLVQSSVHTPYTIKSRLIYLSPLFMPGGGCEKGERRKPRVVSFRRLLCSPLHCGWPAGRPAGPTTCLLAARGKKQRECEVNLKLRSYSFAACRRQLRVGITASVWYSIRPAAAPNRILAVRSGCMCAPNGERSSQTESAGGGGN